jgi:hypothetical protein
MQKHLARSRHGEQAVIAPSDRAGMRENDETRSPKSEKALTENKRAMVTSRIDLRKSA